MKIIELTQGTSEWHQFRAKHLGASDAAVILGLSPWRKPKQLWEEKVLGWEQPVNAHMKRGQDMELQAREAYQVEKGILVNPMVGEHDLFPFLSASFDGLSVDLKIGVEIKCGRASHKLAQEGTLPSYYYAQLQHQMYIADLQEIDYYSFDGQRGILFTVAFDSEFVTQMVDKELAFWDSMVNLTPPEN
jgi:putative phage-type endonuclease